MSGGDAFQQDFITVPGQLFACLSVVGPECPQKCDQFAIKIRGSFPTRAEAETHAKRLQGDDATFDIYVVDLYKWLLIPPKNDAIEDVHYVDAKLNEIMTKYRESQRMAASMFEKRKKDMLATPLPNSDTPFIEPGDENSKYYNKPDVPPITHPADLIDDLKKEFPDMSMPELVKLADARVKEEIDRRSAEKPPQSEGASGSGPA